MSNWVSHEGAKAPAQPVTRRTFLKICGATAGLLAAGALPVTASSQGEAGAARPTSGSRRRTFHLMPHSHIDVEWYWTFDTTRQWTKDILDKAMALLRRDPEFRFTQDQVVLVKSYWEGLNPDERASFKEKNPDLEGDLHLTGEEARSSELTALSIATARDDVTLRVRSGTRFADCLLEREIILYHQLPRIDFRSTLRDFYGGDVLIKVSFAPQLDWRHVRTVYETPFAATPRPEGHFAAQSWVDCSDGRLGLALLNRGTPGYWTGTGKMELVLLRSFANYTGYQKRGKGKRLPDYEHSTQTELARERGTHEFEYALVPHAGAWRTARLPQLGQSYNTALLSLAGLGDAVRDHAGKSFLMASPDFALTALKYAENSQGLVVRGYETRGQAHQVTIQLPKKVSRVHRASLLEEPAEVLPLPGGKVSFHCEPHEIVTLWLQP